MNVIQDVIIVLSTPAYSFIRVVFVEVKKSSLRQIECEGKCFSHDELNNTYMYITHPLCTHFASEIFFPSPRRYDAYTPPLLPFQPQPFFS
jgi:hypothetical protein